MHPRWLRCSFLKYSRYSRSSRLARGAPRPSRCDARLSPRAAKVDLGKNYEGAFQLLLTRPDGSMRAVDPSLPRLTDELSVRGNVTVEPLQHYTQPILLNEWLELAVEYLGRGDQDK